MSKRIVVSLMAMGIFLILLSGKIAASSGNNSSLWANKINQEIATLNLGAGPGNAWYALQQVGPGVGAEEYLQQ